MGSSVTWRKALRGRWLTAGFLIAVVAVGAVLVGAEPVTVELRLELGAVADLESVRVELLAAETPETVAYFEQRFPDGTPPRALRQAVSAQPGTYTAVVSVRRAAGERRVERRVVVDGQSTITLDLSADMK
jgi:hypothetical protein